MNEQDRCNSGPKKIAVAPCFNISTSTKFKRFFRNHNYNAKYYEITSDDFFALKDRQKTFGVIFVDGLHTFQQAKKDVENALQCLSNGGVLVMHDCNPPSKTAAVPAESWEQSRSMKLPDWNRDWCGDVWKTICYLRTHRNDLNVFVLDCDFGLGIICKGTPESRLNLSDEDINNLEYDDFAADRPGLLNLKDEGFLDTFLSSLSPIA